MRRLRYRQMPKTRVPTEVSRARTKLATEKPLPAEFEGKTLISSVLECLAVERQLARVQRRLRKEPRPGAVVVRAGSLLLDGIALGEVEDDGASACFALCEAGSWKGFLLGFEVDEVGAAKVVLGGEVGVDDCGPDLE